jgi:hypothetical protein
MNIVTLIWLFPLFFLIHDLEEILTVESFMAKKRDKVISMLPKRVGQFVLKQFSMTTKQFTVAVGVIFVFVMLGTILGIEAISNGKAPVWFLAVNIVFFVHVFTHAGQSVIMHGYTPGVISAVVLTLPYSWYAFHRLFQVGLVDWNGILVSAPFSLLIIPVTIIAHTMGRRIAG